MLGLDLEGVSHVGGLCSVGLWIVALCPQVILNFRRRSASGLAWGLVCLWLVGDTAGVAGAFLTDQLVFQRIIAVWHWLVDSVLFLQWMLYHQQDNARILVEDRREREILRVEQRLRRRKLSIEQAYHSRDEHITPMSQSRDRPSFSGARGVLLPPRLARTKEERSTAVRRGRRTWSLIAGASLLLLFFLAILVVSTQTSLFDHVLPDRKARHRSAQVGVISAWACATLYLGSRIPQIMHNWRRRSVQGLSVSLFALGVTANAFYVLSVLISPRARVSGAWKVAYLRHALPYLTTAIGASLLDCFILFQWAIYRSSEDPDPRNRLEPGLARREELEASGVFAESPTGSRTPSVDDRTPLLQA